MTSLRRSPPPPPCRLAPAPVVSPLFLVISPVLLLFVSPLLLLRLISPLRLRVVSPLWLLHLLLASPVLRGVVIQSPLLDGIRWVVVVGWGSLALVFVRGFISLGWIRRRWLSLGGIRLDWLSLVGFAWIGRRWGGFAHVGVGRFAGNGHRWVEFIAVGRCWSGFAGICCWSRFTGVDPPVMVVIRRNSSSLGDLSPLGWICWQWSSLVVAMVVVVTPRCCHQRRYMLSMGARCCRSAVPAVRY